MQENRPKIPVLENETYIIYTRLLQLYAYKAINKAYMLWEYDFSRLLCD